MRHASRDALRPRFARFLNYTAAVEIPGYLKEFKYVKFVRVPRFSSI